MPTNLGVLPTNQPLTNGRVQIKRGAVDNLYQPNTGTPGGSGITDGAGNLMGINYTPTYNCYWVVKSNVMAHGWNDGAGWRRWDHGIYINPADANGISLGFQCPHQLYDASIVEWRTVSGTAMFKLNGGVGYTAYLGHSYLSAGTIDVYTGPAWIRIVGRIVGEGST